MLLESLGIQLPDLMAGSAGGVCNVFVMRRQGVVSVIGAVVVGAIIGAYAGPLTRLLPLGHFTTLVAGFAGGALLKVASAQLLKRFPSAFNGAQSA